MRFTKMQGLGNDFILVDAREGDPALAPETVRRLCDRRLGVGADGLLLLLPSASADWRMRVFNADGGEAEMCGNGVRCLASYLGRRGLAGGEELAIETAAGIIRPRIEGETVTVDMGRPVLDGEGIPCRLAGRIVGREVEVGGAARRITCLSMGNPHCVLFVDDLDGCPVATIGPRIEHDPLFPNRVNVGFARVRSPRRIELRVWERGAGETAACGTGACAAAVAGSLNGLTERAVTVRLPGGELAVRYADDGRVFMTGPAEEVFTGEIDIGPGAGERRG
ncbi:MAG: diaminopimelate epimerase [bacterium]|nr:diaminopimelate epimerase [bacterium]